MALPHEVAASLLLLLVAAAAAAAEASVVVELFRRCGDSCGWNLRLHDGDQHPDARSGRILKIGLGQDLSFTLGKPCDFLSPTTFRLM